MSTPSAAPAIATEHTSVGGHPHAPRRTLHLDQVSNDEGVVTPEAVVLELHAAGPGSRIMARLLDLAIQVMVGLILLFFVSMIGVGSEASFRTMTALLAVLAFLVMFVLPVAVETLWRGRSVGKLVLGIRIVTMDGSPISFRHAVVRGAFQIVDVYVPLGVLPLTLTRRSRRFGDLVAGTFALSERSLTGWVAPTVFVPPPGLERYVAELDVGPMEDHQYVFIRSALLRLGALTATARLVLCDTMAADVERLIGTPRPGWLAPEPFLVAVAGAFQVRTGTLDRAQLLGVAEWNERRHAATVAPGWGAPTGSTANPWAPAPAWGTPAAHPAPPALPAPPAPPAAPVWSGAGSPPPPWGGR